MANANKQLTILFVRELTAEVHSVAKSILSLVVTRPMIIVKANASTRPFSKTDMCFMPFFHAVLRFKLMLESLAIFRPIWPKLTSAHE